MEIKHILKVKKKDISFDGAEEYLNNRFNESGWDVYVKSVKYRKHKNKLVIEVNDKRNITSAEEGNRIIEKFEIFVSDYIDADRDKVSHNIMERFV